MFLGFAILNERWSYNHLVGILLLVVSKIG